MKFSASVATAALLATASATPEFAAKRHAAREKRVARRAAEYHTNPLDVKNLQEGSNGAKYGGVASTKTQAGPGGWAGAVMADQTGVSQVQATVTVPTPSIPPNGDGSTTYGGSAWVGIDGYGTDTLWQTGVTWTISDSGSSFSGWYEWFPAGEVPFGNFTVSAGDVISLNLVASGTTSGTAYITNESTGEQVQQTMTGQPALVQQTAEFIVEDFGVSGGSIPFAGFSPAVTFSGCSFTDSNGAGQGISGATITEVGSSSDPFTQCTATGNSVSCTYIGNASNS